MNHDVSQSAASANVLPDEMVGAKEICRALGISYPTFMRMMKEARLPAMRVGRQWKMSRRVLRDFMDGKLGVD